MTEEQVKIMPCDKAKETLTYVLEYLEEFYPDIYQEISAEIGD